MAIATQLPRPIPLIRHLASRGWSFFRAGATSTFGHLPPPGAGSDEVPGTRAPPTRPCVQNIRTSSTAYDVGDQLCHRPGGRSHLQDGLTRSLLRRCGNRRGRGTGGCLDRSRGSEASAYGVRTTGEPEDRSPVHRKTQGLRPGTPTTGNITRRLDGHLRSFRGRSCAICGPRAEIQFQATTSASGDLIPADRGGGTAMAHGSRRPACAIAPEARLLARRRQRSMPTGGQIDPDQLQVPRVDLWDTQLADLTIRNRCRRRSSSMTQGRPAREARFVDGIGRPAISSGTEVRSRCCSRGCTPNFLFELCAPLVLPDVVVERHARLRNVVIDRAWLITRGSGRWAKGRYEDRSCSRHRHRRDPVSQEMIDGGPPPNEFQGAVPFALHMRRRWSDRRAVPDVAGCPARCGWPRWAWKMLDACLPGLSQVDGGARTRGNRCWTTPVFSGGPARVVAARVAGSPAGAGSPHLCPARRRTLQPPGRRTGPTTPSASPALKLDRRRKSAAARWPGLAARHRAFATTGRRACAALPADCSPDAPVGTVHDRFHEHSPFRHSRRQASSTRCACARGA